VINGQSSSELRETAEMDTDEFEALDYLESQEYGAAMV
jgi:hypothetical protein